MSDGIARLRELVEVAHRDVGEEPECDCAPTPKTINGREYPQHGDSCAIVRWRVLSNERDAAWKKLDSIDFAPLVLELAEALGGCHSHEDMSPEKHPLCDVCQALAKVEGIVGG